VAARFESFDTFRKVILIFKIHQNSDCINLDAFALN